MSENGGYQETSKRKSEKMGKIQLQNIQPLIDCWAVMDIPLDFSFFKLTKPADAINHERRDLLGKYPQRRTEDGKYNTRSLRMNNNQMMSLTGFSELLTSLLPAPDALRWLDLSFNKLPNIDPVLCELRQLQILYYHGNDVSELKEVDTLSRIKTLIKLSLHGNPIDQNIGIYRLYVLGKLPQLHDLDMTTVTAADRTDAAVYRKFNPIRTKKKKKD